MPTSCSRREQTRNPAIAVPDSAVIDSGTRQVVLVAKGEGRFEPRAVKLGRRGDGYVEVLDGLDARARRSSPPPPS